MFGWIQKIRQKRLTKPPFPDEWRRILDSRFFYYHYLSDDERDRLNSLIQLFIAKKRFEGLQGFALTDEVRILIAANACLLILELSFDYFRDVSDILVYPSAMVRPRTLFGDRHTHGEVMWKETPLSGECCASG
jgi:Mlc titration factor MtfA (ptsG expression regulator)